MYLRVGVSPDLRDERSQNLIFEHITPPFILEEYFHVFGMFVTFCLMEGRVVPSEFPTAMIIIWFIAGAAKKQVMASPPTAWRGG